MILTNSPTLLALWSLLGNLMTTLRGDTDSLAIRQRKALDISSYKPRKNKQLQKSIITDLFKFIAYAFSPKFSPFYKWTFFWYLYIFFKIKMYIAITYIPNQKAE